MSTITITLLTNIRHDGRMRLKGSRLTVDSTLADDVIARGYAKKVNRRRSSKKTKKPVAPDLLNTTQSDPAAPEPEHEPPTPPPEDS
jgi:hypothetical protein